MARKMFTKHTIILTVTGLALNIALVWLTDILAVPLYLDSIGTVIVAALGGMLPGIIVGFLSNCLTALLAVSPDAMTLYYGFLNVLIAAVTAWLSQRGLLLKWYGKVAAVFALAFIGGALGSMITWILYGFSFGQGISAPLASVYYKDFRMGEFFAQLAADMSIDFADKSLTVIVLSAALRFLPAGIIAKMPLGYVYQNRKKPPKPSELRERVRIQLSCERQYRKRSINTKITLLIIISSTILSIVAVAIGINTYRDKLVAQYTVTCDEAVSMMLPKLDGNAIARYLEEGESSDGYAETEKNLADILNNSSRLKYMYVYAIHQDGCHVVFDIDTPDLTGDTVGEVVPFDESFPYIEQIMNGEEVPALITDDTYGWLLTVYKPVRDSEGRTVAYAAADIDMQEIRTDLYSFCISIISLLFGVLILITTFSLWYCDRNLLEPIGVLTDQARTFNFEGTSALENARDKNAVNTGDELEELYSVMCRTEDELAEHMREIGQKNLEISQMQRNIIYTLANMVENRDGNTGGHIKRTANYVRLIGRKLKAAGVYADIVDDNYIKMLYYSAPLHDIGKIKIPDAILNKPGKLTPEEFEIIKKHTIEGRAILETSLSRIEDGTWLSMAVDMATYHHEKWDGSGYPSGLAGEDIPLCARIMAVSDVFDALVTVRCYKPAYSYEQAISIIRDGSGKHFDPNVVKVFIEADNEVREIMTES